MLECEPLEFILSKSSRLLPTFFSIRFSVSGFMLRSLIHLTNLNLFSFFLSFIGLFFKFTFQMLSPFLVSLPPGNTLSHRPFPCFYDGVPTPTHLLTLDSFALGHLSSLHRAKDLSFHLCIQGHPLLHMQLDPCVLLFLMAYSLGVLGCLVG